MGNSIMNLKVHMSHDALVQVHLIGQSKPSDHIFKEVEKDILRQNCKE